MGGGGTGCQGNVPHAWRIGTFSPTPGLHRPEMRWRLNPSPVANDFIAHVHVLNRAQRASGVVNTWRILVEEPTGKMLEALCSFTYLALSHIVS